MLDLEAIKARRLDASKYDIGMLSEHDQKYLHGIIRLEEYKQVKFLVSALLDIDALLLEVERLQALEKSLNTLKCSVCGEYAYESED